LDGSWHIEPNYYGVARDISEFSLWTEAEYDEDETRLQDKQTGAEAEYDEDEIRLQDKQTARKRLLRHAAEHKEAYLLLSNLFLYVVFIFLWAGSSLTTFRMKERIDKLQNENLFLEARLDDLTSLVYLPSFSRHLKTCAVCSKENKEPSDAIVCEEALRLFKSDTENLVMPKGRERDE
jgi:hypothetical protein